MLRRRSHEPWEKASGEAHVCTATSATIDAATSQVARQDLGRGDWRRGVPLLLVLLSAAAAEA